MNRSINRREFLAMTCAALAATAAGLTQAGSPMQAQVRGVQLYTVRALMEKSVSATLKALAGIGYQQVEFAGYFEEKPAELRKILLGEGLISPAAHLQLSQLREGLQQHLDAAAEVGHQFLVLPWIGESERSEDGYKRLADDLNRWGELCRSAGLRMAYHNHDFEFVTSNDFEPYQWLLDNTDPALVSFEMDLFWLRKAQRDPLDYFRKHPGRFPLWHVKDMDVAGNMVDVGAGIIDFKQFLAAADQSGYRFGFVEHDQPKDPLASVTASFTTARSWNRG
ncbi:sugar phosphate isomerase/epimerase [Microbulbifer bruguierae]|uniref:Sugar phosphate isomerase/epimerase n=1 Tax=Microbulbifer bruguierae TaxID=3029061 RepID=A0ABY8NL06_9GAMM|nr:sugar phosphate isomerase/epimerase [Microbulbifer bruguierae]WGL18392.1 sugar phosphate isomerase/epimerase [Microbulbifer bruguierae]